MSEFHYFDKTSCKWVWTKGHLNRLLMKISTIFFGQTNVRVDEIMYQTNCDDEDLIYQTVQQGVQMRLMDILHTDDSYLIKVINPTYKTFTCRYLQWDKCPDSHDCPYIHGAREAYLRIQLTQFCRVPSEYRKKIDTYHLLGPRCDNLTIENKMLKEDVDNAYSIVQKLQEDQNKNEIEKTNLHCTIQKFKEENAKLNKKIDKQVICKTDFDTLYFSFQTIQQEHTRSLNVQKENIAKLETKNEISKAHLNSTIQKIRQENTTLKKDKKSITYRMEQIIDNMSRENDAKTIIIIKLEKEKKQIREQIQEQIQEQIEKHRKKTNHLNIVIRKIIKNTDEKKKEIKKLNNEIIKLKKVQSSSFLFDIYEGQYKKKDKEINNLQHEIDNLQHEIENPRYERNYIKNKRSRHN